MRPSQHKMVILSKTLAECHRQMHKMPLPNSNFKKELIIFLRADNISISAVHSPRGLLHKHLKKHQPPVALLEFTDWETIADSHCKDVLEFVLEGPAPGGLSKHEDYAIEVLVLSFAECGLPLHGQRLHIFMARNGVVGSEDLSRASRAARRFAGTLDRTSTRRSWVTTL